MSILGSVRQIGLWPYCVYLLGRLLRAMSLGDSVHYCFMAVDLSEVLQNAGKKTIPSLVTLGKGDERLEAIDAPMDVVEARFAGGAVCSALSGKVTLKAWIWSQSDFYDEDEVRARYVLPETAVWDFGAYIQPRYRLGRSFEALWHGFAQGSIHQGKTHSFSRIATHNAASMNAHGRLPHAVLGYCTFIRVFGLQLSMSALLPHWHLSRSDDDQPVFHLNV